MKNLTQEEFEQEVKRIITGEITRKKLAKKLETDIRTLNGKITELSKTNPNLYKTYIDKFPYQPKSREDIDFEALVTEIMQKGMSLENASEKYNISIRTISRRIKEIEKSNPDLIAMYRTYADYLQRAKNIPLELQEKIDRLELKPVILSGITEKRENGLKEVVRKFEELINTGMSKAEAARKLGYDGYPTIWKMYKEIERIKAQRESNESQDKEFDFRDRIKVDVSELNPIQIKENTRDGNIVEKGIDK